MHVAAMSCSGSDGRILQKVSEIPSLKVLSVQVMSADYKILAILFEICLSKITF